MPTQKGVSEGVSFRLTMNKAAIDKLFASSEGPAGKALAKKAVVVEREAKRLAPVDTGRLRASISWSFARDSKGLYALVGSNVSYAAHIEFGTVYMDPQPYLRPALQRVV